MVLLPMFDKLLGTLNTYYINWVACGSYPGSGGVFSLHPFVHVKDKLLADCPYFRNLQFNAFSLSLFFCTVKPYILYQLWSICQINYYIPLTQEHNAKSHQTYCTMGNFWRGETLTNWNEFVKIELSTSKNIYRLVVNFKVYFVKAFDVRICQFPFIHQ